jgi:hypothetical protein
VILIITLPTKPICLAAEGAVSPYWAKPEHVLAISSLSWYPLATLPRFPDLVFPFVTCEPSINHCTLAKAGRLYE